MRRLILTLALSIATAAPAAAQQIGAIARPALGRPGSSAGKNPTQVTTSAENELPGDWSRDMKHAVVDYSLVTPDGPPISDLAIVELSNGTVTKLTNTEAISEGHPFLVH